MKRATPSLLVLAGALALLVALAARGPGQGQPAPTTPDLIRTLATQQAAIAANNDKIDQAIAELAEEIRLARIYAKRTGGGTGD